jgi:hypothetical protein
LVVLDHLLCPARFRKSTLSYRKYSADKQQPLSIYALVRFPVNRWITFCFFGWSISCMICAAFDNFAGLVVFRFILGAFESSISPCMSTSIGGPEVQLELILSDHCFLLVDQARAAPPKQVSISGAFQGSLLIPLASGTRQTVLLSY